MQKITKLALNKLKEVDSVKGVLSIAGDYLVILLAITLFYLNNWFYPISLILLGSRLQAFANLVHEGTHRTVLKDPTWNDWIISIFCAFPLHISLWKYRVSHLKHHLKAIKSEDTTLSDYDYFPLELSQMRWHLLKVFTCSYGNREYLKFFEPLWRSSKTEKIVRLFYWGVILTIITFYNAWTPFTLFYLVPFITVYCIINRLVIMTEHCVWETESLKQSRNVFTNPLLQFLMFPHSDYLHLTHHISPKTPSWNLFKAHQLLMNEPDYANGNHCQGYYFGQNSVLAKFTSSTKNQILE
jgi:fatty acid desaturase